MAKKFSFKEQWKLSFRYLMDSRNYIVLSLVFFIFFFMLGFIFPFFASETLYLQVAEQIKNMIKDLISQTEGYNPFEMWWFIFTNNSSIAFFSIFLGIILGIVPGMLLFSNGLIIGLILSFVSIARGGDINVLFQILPHGVFEIPAIIISFALGIKLGSFVFKDYPRKFLAHYFKNSVRVFLFIIIPLLLIASVIETALIVLFS